MSEKTIRIYSYKKVWKVEKKIYSLQNIRLPFPVNPYEVMEFIGAAAVIFVLGFLFPPFESIPSILRFIALPYLLTQFLMKKKLDGKNPIKYFLGCVIYFFTIKGKYLQQLKMYPEKREKIRLDWSCSMGRKME